MTVAQETATASTNRAELARKLGIEPEQISTRSLQWGNLLRDGVIVQLSIGRVRGRRKLEKEDLGLQGLTDEEYDRFFAEHISLGVKKLLPSDILIEGDTIERAIRKNLEKASFRSLWGYFVPVTAWRKWVDSHEKLKQRYYDLLAKELATYQDMVDEVRASYLVAANAAWRRAEEVIRSQGVSYDEFVQNFVARIAGQIPSEAEIEESFYVREAYFRIPLPSEIAEEAARLEATRQQTERDQMRDAMETEMMQRMMSQKESALDGFLTDVMKQLRQLAYDTSIELLESIKKNEGRVVAPSFKSLKSLIEQVKDLNFYGDDDLQGKIDQLNDLVSLPREVRSNSEIQTVLQDMATITRQFLVSAGVELRSARNVGISDVPDASEVETAIRRQTRQLSLEATDDDMLPAVTRRSRVIND